VIDPRDEPELDLPSNGVSSVVAGASSRTLDDGPGVALPEPGPEVEICAGEVMAQSNGKRV